MINQQLYNQMISKGFNQQEVFKYEGAIFILHTIARTLQKDMQEYLNSFGVKGDLSKLNFNLDKAYQDYMSYMSPRVPEEQTLNFFSDVEAFESDVRKFAGLNELKLYKK